MSYRNSIRLLNINAPRGIIYDRYDRVTASNALSFGVFIVPQETEDVDSVFRKLSKILGTRTGLLKRNYKRNYRAPFAPCEVIRGIPRKKAILVEELKLDMPGVLVREIPLREYPYKDALAHVVGYLGEIDKRELELLRSYGYSVKDLIGKSGIEKVSDKYLRGRNGGMQIQIDNRGRQVKVMSSRKSEKGRDVYLTIDAEFQNFIWKMMKGKKGAVVFMDPYNGEILSLVSSPSYDPNNSLGGVLSDPSAPLLNRAIAGQYPPGSLFKIVVALAGLESGKATPLTAFVCRGKVHVGADVFHCWNKDGHGPMGLKNAIIESCNSYFYSLGISLGVDSISEYAKLFGLGRKTGIELSGEQEGFVPRRAWKKTKKKENWYGGDTANLSIGQGYLLATPLQAARLISLVVNGGELVEPHLVKKISGQSAISRKKTKLKIKKQNLELIAESMKGVVEDEDGTGMRAWSELVSISGKTGTSQTGKASKTHAWFGGFAPSENPEISFVVFLEHGGSGGDIAALMARKAVEYWYKNRGKSKSEKIQRF